MPLEIHYEIFRRHGARDSWLLREVMSDRDTAIRFAEQLMREEKATGVKVVKETYHPDTGDYLSLKIYEDGHTRMKMQQAAEDMPNALPCSLPDDLYTSPARATIARLLSDFLARNRWTVTELIHRGDALAKLEATGTLYQHAVQKLAVAQAASTIAPVAQIIKNLNELSTKAIHRVYRDERRDYFPDVTGNGFAAFAARSAQEADGPYLLNGAIARALKPAKTWNDKLASLLGLLDDALPDEAGRPILIAAVDAITAELLNCSAALHEVIGKRENLGDALDALVLLFSGDAPSGAQSSVSALARHFAADTLVESRTAIAGRILAEFRSVRRLSHGSVTEELGLLRHIANSLVQAPLKYLDRDALVAAFTLRSRRLVAHEAVSEHLSDARDAAEKIDRLMLIEENIVGVENKRLLSTFITPILTSNQFDAQFLNGKTPALTRMQRLAELQSRVRRSALPEKEKTDIADFLDRVANDVDQRAKVLESLEHRAAGHIECAVALLKLCAGGALTEGRLSTRARAMILRHIGKPGFLTGYTRFAARGGQPDPGSAMKELMETLAKAGIAPEQGLKTIAA